MFTKDLNIAPYHDDHDPSKGYSQILAVPGYAIQAREITQLQSILMHSLRKASDTILKEGSVVSGMSYTKMDNTIIIHPGRIYLGGIVHEFKEQSIEITGEGRENIGVKLITSIITSEEDPSLRDPALETINFNQPGSHRLKHETSLTLNDDTTPTVYIFEGGNLFIDNQRPELDVIHDILARRMYDQSGNYKIHGLTMYSRTKDENNLTLVVESGKAYIMGYEVNKPSPTLVTLPKSLQTRNVIGELKVYQSATSRYRLNNAFVKEISRVTGTVQVTDTLTKGSRDGIDLLTKSPVVSIVSVTQGGTTYTQDTDFRLDGDGIDWSLGGSQPSTGSTYTVVFRYSKTLTTDDYKVTHENTYGYIDFTGMSGDTPVTSTNLSVDYSFYLSRKDRVYLDRDGEVTVVQGQSDIARLATVPPDIDETKLSLGTITLSPNGDDAILESVAIKRSSMKDIGAAVNRLDNLEYNQAIQDLDNEAMSGESPTSLRGIFTDGFIGFSKMDLSYSGFNVAINPVLGNLVLPSESTPVQPVIATSESSVTVFDNYSITCKASEEVIVSQPLCTEAININPYMVFFKNSKLQITPSVDNWIDTTTITIQEYQTQLKYMSDWWSWQSSTTTSSSVINSVVSDSIIPYARQIEIEMNIEDLPPNTDLLYGYIDDVQVSLTPTNGTPTGSSAGTIRSKSDGTASAKFTIPKGIRTGNREVKIANPVTSATTIFSSKGIDRQITNTVLNTTTKYQGTRQQPVDPVAQTFVLNTSRFVTGVDLFFATKDPTCTVTVQITNVVNGYPGTQVLASKTLNPSQIGTSTNGTVATRVNFPTPAFCESGTSYSVVVMTDSDKCTLYIATLGQKLIGSTSFMTRQPYVEGVMFTSSNTITWTPVQESDIKFNLIGAVFQPTSILSFNEIPSVDLDSLVLVVDQAVLSGTSCQWEFSTDVNNWLPLEVYTTRELTSTATKVKLRATLKGTRTLSPVIYKETLNLLLNKMDTVGKYVSKEVITSQEYTEAKLIMEGSIPVGCSVVPKIYCGSSWVTPTLQGTESIDGDWSRYTYLYQVPSSDTVHNYRVSLDITTNSRIVRPKVRKLMNIIK